MDNDDLARYVKKPVKIAKNHMIEPNKRSRSKTEDAMANAKTNAKTVCLLGNEELFFDGISKRTRCITNGRGLK